LLLAAAQGYVSFRAQYAFVDHAKHARIPSILEALGLDTGAVIFALLALALASRGRPATPERILNVACAFGSLTMNLLAADLASPRSVAVWVLPSALYALTSDRLIAVMRRWVQETDHHPRAPGKSPARRAPGAWALWMLRLVFDARGTVAGLRRWVLVAAPVAPSLRPDAVAKAVGSYGPRGQIEPTTRRPAKPLSGRAPGETKRAALIRLYELCGETGDSRYGDRSKTAALASEIAAQIGYHPGTARRELARYLATRAASPSSQPEPAADSEAVA
jgi:hypothetical protein